LAFAFTNDREIESLILNKLNKLLDLNNKTETIKNDDEMFKDNKFEITMSPKKNVDLNESRNDNVNKLDTSIANTSIEINVKVNLLGDESKNAISVNNLNDSINERA